MKRLTALVLLIMLIASCENSIKTDRDTPLGDTITTPSGLQYVFLKKGKGPKVEIGSKVKVYTDLYLNDADTTIWRTADDKDSVFTFIHRKTSLIKGFTELYDYLMEGDEVIAILPDSLAYGEKGRGIVPPKATLVYNPLEVKYVSEPKESITDTLLSLAKTDQMNAVISFYEKSVAGGFEVTYHNEIEDLMDVVYEFMRDSSFVQLEEFSAYLANKVSDEDEKHNFYAYQTMALENQGKVEEAIKIVSTLSEGDLNREYWQTTLKRLKEIKK